MSHRYQVIIQGTGFSTSPDGEGDSIIGFFAIRRVLADTEEEAYWTAVRALEREEKFQWLVERTHEHIGEEPRHRFQLDDIGHLPWWRWHFTRSPKNYAFYSEAEADVPVKA